MPIMLNRAENKPWHSLKLFVGAVSSSVSLGPLQHGHQVNSLLDDVSFSKMLALPSVKTLLKG